jgi:hypothetical protein
MQQRGAGNFRFVEIYGRLIAIMDLAFDRH